MLDAWGLMLEHLPDPSTKGSTKGAAEGRPLCGGGRRPPPFVDEAIKLLGSEAIKLLGYEAIRLYGHMAINTELNTEFGAGPIYCRPHSRFLDSLENIRSLFGA